MKKIVIFFLFLSIITIALFSVSALTEKNQVSTYETISNSDHNAYDGNYYYKDYEDLLNQVYEDVYNDLYQDLYTEISLGVNNNLYEDINAKLIKKMNEVINQSSISLNVDKFQEKIFDIIELADKSVFAVASYLGSESKGVGSGVIYRYDEINNEYYIITNHHVVREGNNFTIVFPDSKEYIGDLIGYDTEVDIAILKFKALDQMDIQISPLGDSSFVHKGDFVISVGNPQGLNFYSSTTLGIISGLNRKLDANKYIDYIQHDSAINPGNSGGPIYNFSGEVVGINVSKLANTNIEGMGFALPINLVKKVISRIEADNLPYNTIVPRLGADYYDVAKLSDDGEISVYDLIINGDLIDTEITLTLPVGLTTGFLVYNIPDQSTLDDTVIKSGDIIFKINDFLITDLDSYFEYIYQNFEAGDSVVLSYYSLNHNTLKYEETIKTVTVEFK